MKATTSGLNVAITLAMSAVLASGQCQTSQESVPLTGIGSVRPLRSSSSFTQSEPEVGWDPSTNSSTSSGVDDADTSATNSSSSSVVDTGITSTNSSSSSSSSEVVYAIETIFTNSSDGAGDPESNHSSPSTNISAVEEELIETLEVDQQVTGEGSAFVCTVERH